VKPSLVGAFDALSPDAAQSAVEGALGLNLDGSMLTYPSYANRVYGFRTDDAKYLVAKFYRPGRWTETAIREEHLLVRECAEAELPVARPLELRGGGSLGILDLENDEGMPAEFVFAVYPRMGGRNFDAERDEDWRRLGSVVARLHTVGARRTAPARQRLTPLLIASFVQELLDAGLVHPRSEGEFSDIAEETLNEIAAPFEQLDYHRIHGDLHRGNILDRPGEGLYLIDFDDMAMGPAVQDIWLLLPGRAGECRRELAFLIEGYEEFRPFDKKSLSLIEGLRFMRMLYFLAWRSRQRGDRWFDREFPDWGTSSFWSQEVEGLREQASFVREALDY